MSHKLIILDVDGTLVKTSSGETFRQTADDWEFLPGRVERCKLLTAQGVKLAIATNQAGVAFPWSKYSEEQMQRETEFIARQFKAGFIAICYTSTNQKALPKYHNLNDTRRKPGPGMLLEAMQHYGISPEDTLMVGDRDEDEQAAKAAGVAFEHADSFFGGDQHNELR